jgi:hypothetical protein
MHGGQDDASQAWSISDYPHMGGGDIVLWGSADR